MSSTGEDFNVTSPEIQYDSYYGYTDGVGTLQVFYDDFVGRLRLQATLDLDPVDSDWFDVVPQNVVIVRTDGILDDGRCEQYIVTQNSLTNELGFVVGQSSSGFVSVPVGQEWNANGYTEFTTANPGRGSASYVIRGNFTHIRAQVDRSYLPTPPVGEPWSLGQIQRIILTT